MSTSPAPRPASFVRELVTALQAELSDDFPQIRFQIELAMFGTSSLELTLSWTDPGGRASSVSCPVDLLAASDDRVDDVLDAVYERVELRAAA